MDKRLKTSKRISALFSLSFSKNRIKKENIFTIFYDFYSKNRIIYKPPSCILHRYLKKTFSPIENLSIHFSKSLSPFRNLFRSYKINSHPKIKLSVTAKKLALKESMTNNKTFTKTTNPVFLA